MVAGIPFEDDPVPDVTRIFLLLTAGSIVALVVVFVSVFLIVAVVHTTLRLLGWRPDTD